MATSELKVQPTRDYKPVYLDLGMCAILVSENTPLCLCNVSLVGHLGGLGSTEREFINFFSTREIYGLERTAGGAGVSDLDS